MSFKQLQTTDKVISTDAITGTVWSGNAPTLTNMFTSSVQYASNTGQYYIHVYQTSSNDPTSAVQFDIAYGDKVGSGSLFFNNQVTGSSPSKSTYGQYRTLVLGDENAQFVFGNFSSSYFYALSVERARYKEKLAIGTMTLKLSGSGVNGGLVLTDNSQIATSTTFNDAGRVFQIVSGSAGKVHTGTNANGFTPSSGSYGLFMPDIGLILLNGEALDGNATGKGINLGTQRQFDTDSRNTRKLYTALSGSKSFLLNSEESISSEFIFCRGQNFEFNFSENPSFISGSNGAVIFDQFINNPQTFITSVGLYNQVNELVAVAKLSRPLLKDFTKELLVRVKLDF
tara:strand:+ start:477 stop:1502 length:1026 start_codon:yes stop_codon:yes gene_type:complete